MIWYLELRLAGCKVQMEGRFVGAKGRIKGPERTLMVFCSLEDKSFSVCCVFELVNIFRCVGVYLGV